MNITTEYIIAPPTRWPSINWAELLRYRDLFFVLAWRDIAIRYKQTALGVLWAIFQPLVTMVIFTVIFNRMAGITSGDSTPYPIFLYVGLLLWQYYSNTLNNTSNSMLQNAAIIQKVYFPRLIIPTASAVAGLIDFAIGGVILFGMMIFYHCYPQWLGIVLLPLLVGITFLSALSLGFTLASLNIKYRDVRYALPFFIQILMYLIPVIYPAKLLEKYLLAKWLALWLLPISGVITVARSSLLGNSPIDWPLLGISLLMSIVYFFGGLYYFRKTERYFADIA